MSSQVCVNCFNKKTVNQTDNRLVTESCGHVKCMDCLLHEKAGCVACISNGSEKQVSASKPEEVASEPVEKIKTCTVPMESDELNQEEQDLCTKKKLEITHIKVEISDGKRTYKCTVCEKKFSARSQVSYHAYCNGQKKPYQCQSCEQSFASLSHYQYHLRTHSRERKFSCDMCLMTFYNPSKLKRHTLKHTKEKNYICNECNKGFNNLTALRKHALTHTEERPYACAACGRRFRDGSNYRKHVQKHKNLCEKCGEMLPVGKGTEKVHQCAPSAAGPRPHPCPRCRKAFHSKKDMRRHAATHSDSKPFRCKLCDEERRFRRKDNLERHIRNTHSNCSTTAALECDLVALQAANDASTDNYEKSEKIRLEILNPLPPLPQEIINEHIKDVKDKETNNKISDSVKDVKTSDVTKSSDSAVDTMSIIEANNARESVIVEKRIADNEKKVLSPENEYVHKIRKAIIPLPPIDQEKFRSVQRGNLPDSGSAPIKNKELYQKILFEKEKDTMEVIQNPKMHWRRKMEQDIN